MMNLALWILMGSTAWASRKSDSVRLLIAEKRYEDAQAKCTKWKAMENDAETSLREYCAQAFWPKAEGLDTIAGWQEYQNQWVGTDWAKKGFEREGLVALRTLPDTSPEEAYLEIVEQFSGYKVAEKALLKAGAAAIRDVQSNGEARRVASIYGEHEDIMDLVKRYPEEFVSVSIDGDSVKVKPKIQIGQLIQIEPHFWAFKEDEQIKKWDDVVKEHLEDAGIEPVAIMRQIQNHQGGGAVFPLCQIPGMTDNAMVGVAVPVEGNYVFESVGWDPKCENTQSAVAVYSRKQLQYFSYADEYSIDLGLKKGGRKNFTSFVRRTGDAILFDNSIYVPVGKSFVRYPLTGAQPWLTDKPPGGLRYKLDTTLRGTGIPKGWGIQGVSEGIEIKTPNAEYWVVPSGELRFFSPLVLDLLGMNGFERSSQSLPEVEWQVDASGVFRAPIGAVPIDVRKLTEQEIKANRNHIGGAGLDPYQLNVVDGFAVDLDNDRTNEKVIRAIYNEQEMVLVLDSDEKQGNRTFIYSTNHAIHGKMAASEPFAIKVEEQILFAWSGIEDKRAYLEIVYSQDGSFMIAE